MRIASAFTKFLVGLTISTAASLTNAETIDFNSGLPSGCFTAYTAKGVTFSATDGLGLTNSRWGNTPNGTPGIIGCFPAVLPGLSTIRAQFDTVFNGQISVDLGDFGVDNDNMFLRAFNSDGLLIAEATSFIPSSFVGMTNMTISGTNIQYTIIGATAEAGSSVYLDNFSYEISAVTEPSAATLLVLGGILLTTLRRIRLEPRDA